MAYGEVRDRSAGAGRYVAVLHFVTVDLAFGMYLADTRGSIHRQSSYAQVVPLAPMTTAMRRQPPTTSRRRRLAPAIVVGDLRR